MCGGMCLRVFTSRGSSNGFVPPARFLGSSAMIACSSKGKWWSAHIIYSSFIITCSITQSKWWSAQLVWWPQDHFHVQPVPGPHVKMNLRHIFRCGREGLRSTTLPSGRAVPSEAAIAAATSPSSCAATRAADAGAFVAPGAGAGGFRDRRSFCCLMPCSFAHPFGILPRNCLSRARL